MKKAIKLYYQNIENNFGDVLSREIVTKVSSRTASFSPFKKSDLVAIGSLAERVVKKSFKRWLLNLGHPVDMWGTGFLAPGSNVSSRFIRIHALRGKLSAARFGIGDGLVAVGDPGLLCSHLFPQCLPDGKGNILCLPHLHDRASSEWVESLRRLFPHNKVDQLSLANDYKIILAAIASSEMVVTTAMHPYIAAHSYDVPVLYLQTGDNIHMGGDYKLRDYLSVYGRDGLNTIDCGQLMSGDCCAEQLLELAADDRVPADDVKRIQQALLDAFPQEYCV
ncbi:polysaccharide pyruvyl transferase family protein [Marinobacterium sp. MBR-109]|jgi:hypothetical protein|uniref:polysaccharide pyruvyl transferase family protein n=1 Tax=Marinobacterium sp. MBR-109 TaxID=3156462 RepID=UPI0033933413